MSRTIKICGLSDLVSLDAALDACADMVGFVFFEKSPRHLSYDAAEALGRHVVCRAKKVALSVDADDATLAAIVEHLEPDVLQLHGHETPERVAEVRARFDRPVMKALALASTEDLAAIKTYERVADYLLFDAPPGADRPGGNGEAFDWSLLRNIETPKPWLLAGGLTCDNVEAALHATGAPGVDVSSGVELAPGRKDPAKITRFVALARAAS